MSNSISAEREKHQWWAVSDDSVQFVTGYSCGFNDSMWWCPEVGYTLTVKHHLFETEAEAIDKLLGLLTDRIAAASTKIEALQSRRRYVVQDKP